jgi:hypothetical protein
VKRAKDGTYQIAPGWGPAKGIVFEGNRYYGRHVDAPNDARPGKVPGKPRIDWSAPEFDPAQPAGFDAFLKRHRKWMLHLFKSQFGAPVKLGEPRPLAHP